MVDSGTDQIEVYFVPKVRADVDAIKIEVASSILKNILGRGKKNVTFQNFDER